MHDLLGHGDLHRLLLGSRLDAVSPHQQTMGIYAVGRAGHQRHQILPLHGEQRLYLVRLHHQNLIHLVKKLLAQYPQRKAVPRLHLVKIGEQQRRRQPPVTGKHRMGALSAHRQRGTAQMPDPMLQHLL